MELSKATGLSENTLRMRKSRGDFNNKDLVSVAKFVMSELLKKEARPPAKPDLAQK